MKKTYLNKGGTHTALDGTVTPKGGTITTEEDLVAKFGSRKFALMQPGQPVPAAPAAPEAPKAPDTNEDADSGDDVAPDGMDDVTADFPVAEAHDLTVKKDKRGWWVFDGDEDPANEKPLRKKDVDVFLEEYLAE
jgi:hypothetical protein